MGYKVAVVGATGAVGREMLTTLAERDFPADEVVALASGRSAGGQISFGEDRTLTVRDLAGYDFAGTDIALFSAGGDVSKEYAPQAGDRASVEIDNRHTFRLAPVTPPGVHAVTTADLWRPSR